MVSGRIVKYTREPVNGGEGVTQHTRSCECMEKRKLESHKLLCIANLYLLLELVGMMEQEQLCYNYTQWCYIMSGLGFIAQHV